MRKFVIGAALTLALLSTQPLGLARAQREKAISDGDIEVLAFENMFYPPLAWTARIEGTVTVKVELNDRGRVTDASVISGHPAFTALCLENVKKWLFRPNASNTAVVVYNFRIIPGRCNSASSMFVLQGKNMATVLACPLNPNESSTQ